MTGINYKRLLIADDILKNREAAQSVFPNATYASSELEAIACIDSNEFDFLLSDLEMERKVSGLYVIKEAFSHNLPGLIVTNADKGHTGTIVAVHPYNNGIIDYKDGKENPKVWESIKDILDNPPNTLYLLVKVLSLGRLHNQPYVPDNCSIFASYGQYEAARHLAATEEFLASK